MSAKKILVVEDDKSSAIILTHKLKGSGYSVVSAADGATAVHLVGTEHPDLIILDLGLPAQDPFSGPNWDGFGVIDWLHRSRPTEPIPIIVVTAWDPIRAKKRSLDAGAIAYFQKPAPYDELLATIKHALGETGTAEPTQADSRQP